MGKSATIWNLDIVTEYPCGGEFSHSFSTPYLGIHLYLAVLDYFLVLNLN